MKNKKKSKKPPLKKDFLHQFSKETIKKKIYKQVELIASDEDYKDKITDFIANLVEEASKVNLVDNKWNTWGMDAFEQFTKQNKSFAVAYVDLNNLKGMNDIVCKSHQEADIHIYKIINYLKSCGEVFTRQGSDELLVVGNNAEELREDMMKTEQKINDYVKQKGLFCEHPRIKGVKIPFGISYSLGQLNNYKKTDIKELDIILNSIKMVVTYVCAKICKDAKKDKTQSESHINDLLQRTIKKTMKILNDEYYGKENTKDNSNKDKGKNLSEPEFV